MSRSAVFFSHSQFFETEFPTEPESSKLTMLAGESQGSSCLYLPGTEITSECCKAWVSYMNVEISDSGPQVHTTKHTLSTESFHQSHVSPFSVYRSS